MLTTNPRLEKNICNAFGTMGKRWLDNLPEKIALLAKNWQLKDIVAIENMTWSYLGYATQHNHPLVLKLVYDQTTFSHEYTALVQFQHLGAIHLVDHDPSQNALLLERALPGTSLKSVGNKEKIRIYSQLAQSLGAATSHTHDHISTWLSAIDNLNTSLFETQLVESAKTIRAQLINSITDFHLCHGDLHFDNIIESDNGWRIIDPKGVIGNLAFEVSAFDFENEEQILALAKANTIEPKYLISWVFLRHTLAAQWLIEDHANPSEKIQRATYYLSLLAR